MKPSSPVLRILLVLFLLGVAALLALGVLSSMTKTVETATVSGVQLRPHTWRGTITVTGDTYFTPWTTLTVEPGTTVRFEKGAEVEGTDWESNADAYIKDNNDPTGRKGYKQSHYSLYGKVIATGTNSAPIVFTSAQDAPEYADWDELVLAKGSRLDYVELAYAHNGVNVSGDNVTITNSTIHDSLWSCVDLFSSENVVENNEIYHCWHQAVGVKKNNANTIRKNYIHDANLGVNCEYGATPTVEGNHLAAAPISPECGEGKNTTTENRPADTKGGTYNGTLIYPAL